jgi:hypothetical protein
VCSLQLPRRGSASKGCSINLRSAMSDASARSSLLHAGRPKTRGSPLLAGVSAQAHMAGLAPGQGSMLALCSARRLVPEQAGEKRALCEVDLLFCVFLCVFALICPAMLAE